SVLIGSPLLVGARNGPSASSLREPGGRRPGTHPRAVDNLAPHRPLQAPVLLSHRSARYRWTAAPVPGRAARTPAAGTTPAAAPGGHPAGLPPPGPGRCGGPGCSLRPGAAAAPGRHRRPRPAPRHAAGPGTRPVHLARPPATTPPAAVL